MNCGAIKRCEVDGRCETIRTLPDPACGECRMLDLKTVVVVSTATAMLQTIAWCSVCLAWRHLQQMKYFALGFAAIAIGLGWLLLRGKDPGVFAIVISNLLVKIGLLLIAEGLFLFLGQKSRARLWLGVLLAYTAFWTFVTINWPADIALRIHSSTLFTLLAMALMAQALWRDRSLPLLLRWVTIGVLGYYMAASLIHSLIEILYPLRANNLAVMNDRNSWYLLQGNLFLIAIFACLLFMASLRLSEKLRQNNLQLRREVEERKALQLRLNESLEAERSLRDEQRDLMRVVAHEFRTPLVVMRNAIEMIALKDRDLSEETKERLQGVSDGSNRLLMLVKRFLTTEQQSAFQPEYVSVEALLTGVRSHFDASGEGERLVVSTSATDALICLDEDMILTVLINLIDNALKFSAPNQQVRVSFKVCGGWFEVSVRDHGIGIPDADRPKIGRRFYRASNAGAVTGSGLGLYAARKMLGYHRGTLEVKPVEEGGTRCLMRLPLIAHGQSETAYLREEVA